jgi:predicted nucleic acid-binding protein
MKTLFRTVPDTNIIISSEYGNIGSPNREYFQRWKKKEFDLLYSDDTLKELRTIL